MDDIVEHSFLFGLFVEEREEILRHKWVLSEKAGYDVGYDVALFSWLKHHRRQWYECQLKRRPKSP